MQSKSSTDTTQILDLLSNVNVGLGPAKLDYDNLRRYINVTSYSMLSELHRCPRAFQLSKAGQSSGLEVLNIDFAFGHSVGDGAVEWLRSRDLDKAILTGMLSWGIPFDFVNNKKKSIWEATFAIMQFPAFYEQTLEDWDLFVLPNGKPAIELSICVVFPTGYKHYIHIDAVLKHRYSGKIAVYEGKTLGMNEPESSLYANSNQALSYACIMDALELDAHYEVFYSVYCVPARKWELLPFSKDSTLRAEWILDVQMDHAAISTYRELQFFPKRGESCYNFGRRCQWFGMCNAVSGLPEFDVLPDDEHAEESDFVFTLDQIVNKQLEKAE